MDKLLEFLKLLWSPNAKTLVSHTITLGVAGRAYPLPDMQVLPGMTLLIKAYPTNALGSLIYVAGSDSLAQSPFTSHPLIPNESFNPKVKNASSLWVSTNVANSMVTFTTEAM